MKRRDFIAAAGGIALTPIVAQAAGKAGEEEKIIDYLFVQMSPKASLANGVLTLSDANPHTLYFSDRPERIVGRVTLEEFVDAWDGGTDSFKEDPPNAVLTIHHETEPTETVMVLRAPQLKMGSLSYSVEILDGPAEVSGEAASLFIDTAGAPNDALSYSTQERRAVRRTARRTARRVSRRN